MKTQVWGKIDRELERTAVRAKAGIGGRVRCLGENPEHTFYSPDRRRVRVCPACRVALADAPPLLARVVKKR